jgi:leucyl/phenylalanyl-tRNA--protein transferase
MAIIKFPPVSKATEDGLLAVGGDLEVPSLLLAYRSGIFPWPIDDRQILWFSPPVRGVLFFNKLHIPQSLKRERKQRNVSFFFNRDFDSVIEACSKMPRAGQQLTWITNSMIEAYKDLHKAGYCSSFECYEDDILIGGGYGVKIDNFFAGESLFYKKSNGSKLALWWLCEELEKEGLKWIDCQMVTPLLKSFGAAEIQRADYIKLLKQL